MSEIVSTPSAPSRLQARGAVRQAVAVAAGLVGGFHQRRLLVAAVFLAIFSFDAARDTDIDFWWHLKTGELIARAGAIPTADPFSYTALGRPWVAHEWLWELAVYGVYQLGGYGLAALASALIVTLTYAVLYRLLRQLGTNELVSAGLVVWASALALPSVGVRPRELTHLFLILYVSRLLLYREGRVRHLWSLPPVMAVWVNAHGPFILGLGVLALFVVGETGSWLLSRGKAPRHLWLVGLATVAASFVNPAGPRMLLYPIGYYLQGENPSFKNVTEFQSPNFHEPIYLVFAASILLLMVVGTAPPVVPPWTGGRGDPPVVPPHEGRRGDPPVVPPHEGRRGDPPCGPPVDGGTERPPCGAPARGGTGIAGHGLAAESAISPTTGDATGQPPPRTRGGLGRGLPPEREARMESSAVGWARSTVDALLLIGFTLQALVSVRHVAVYALVAAPLLAVRLWDRFRLARELAPPRLSSRLVALNWLLLITVAALGFWYAAQPGVSGRLQVGPEPNTDSLPVAGARFVEDEGLPDPVFNHQPWGGYLIYRWYPDRRVFVDGRVDLYGLAIVGEYREVVGIRPGWQGVLDRYGIRTILIEKDSALSTLLLADGRWDRVFQGQVEDVFVRRGGE